MATLPYAKNIRFKLALAINSMTTSIILDNVSGLPKIGSNESYLLKLEGISSEYVRVTAASGNTLTVSRGAESSTPASWPKNTSVLFAYTENYYITDGNKGDVIISENGTVFEVTSGGGGAVDSVNGQTGVVLLDADDIDDTSTTNKFVTSGDLTNLGNLSGTNTGDQTSIVGISGTKTQFDTACSDGNFLYVGDVTQYTDEMSQDATASLIQNGTGITWTYNDGANTLTPTVTITQYTDEQAQDAIGAMIDSTLVYTDSAPLLTRAALTGDVTASAGSNTTTIADGAVTLAKQANMATGSLVYRKTTGSGAPEVNTLATLKTDLGLTGTNSGDQTTIVGISGTKAEFDTACSNGNFLYTGDAYVPGGTDVAVADGGTNLSSYTSGDIIYASGSTALSKLGIGSTGAKLQVASGIPAWKGGLSSFVIYKSAAQSVSYNTITKLLIDTVSVDTGSFFNAANNRVIPTIAGIYFVQSNIVFTFANGAAAIGAYVYKNGSAITSLFTPTSAASGSTAFGSSAGTLVSMNGSTDYLEIYVYQVTSGTNSQSTGGGVSNNSLFGFLVEPS